MTTFQPRLDILPVAQRRVWAELRTDLPASFVLYEGTALALRTGSRQSEDFDFFANDSVDPAPTITHSTQWAFSNEQNSLKSGSNPTPLSPEKPSVDMDPVMPILSAS